MFYLCKHEWMSPTWDRNFIPSFEARKLDASIHHLKFCNLDIKCIEFPWICHYLSFNYIICIITMNAVNGVKNTNLQHTNTKSYDQLSNIKRLVKVVLIWLKVWSKRCHLMVPREMVVSQLREMMKFKCY